jgi:hypothetical protein
VAAARRRTALRPDFGGNIMMIKVAVHPVVLDQQVEREKKIEVTYQSKQEYNDAKLHFLQCQD